MTNSFETGGSERQFTALAKSLHGTSYRVQVGCIAKRGGVVRGFEEAQEFPVGGSLYGANSMRPRLRLGRYLRNSDVAIAHAFDFYTNLLLIPTARLARVPVVIGSQRQLGDLLTPAKARAQSAVLRWCDRVVCNSRAAAEALILSGFPENRTVIIGNGVDTSLFASAAPALTRRLGVFGVGMIARMNTRSKNHREFLRAAALVHRDVTATEFIVVGDGPLRQELEREAASLGIGDCTHFLGERHDIASILRSLDVSVLPSASESLSNVILESMSAGVPVIATRAGGNAEVIADDRGMLVDPGNVEALAAAILHLLQNAAKRMDLGFNGQKFVESNFSLSTMRKRYEELYTELLEAASRRSSSRRSISFSKSSVPPRLRIAIIAASSHYVGGQSVQAELLLSNWRGDPEVEASFIPIDPSFPRALKWVGSIPFLRTLMRQPFYLAALWQGLSRTDVAHIFSASYWSFLLAAAPAWMVARARGKKALIHYHSGEARDHLRRFWTARPVLANADRLVVPSRYLVEIFREFGLDAEAVPNIVDFSQFTFRRRRPLRPHLLCTRGFHPYYRVDLVVRAFAEVQREFPSARLDLLGEGPEEEHVRSLASQLNLTHVNFAGVVSREKIASFYDAADIFINASALDNMPVSILEAFASGTPVVSTAPEGLGYLVEHEYSGLLSEPGDPGALAANVIRLLRDPDLSSRIALNAHERSKQNRWTAVREQWLAIYRTLAGRTAGVARIPVSASATTLP
jgi:glycosyltransferase involved in cell wall biosynthesis